MAKRKTTKKKTTKKTRSAPIKIVITPQERMTRPVLPAFQGQIATGLATGIQRPADFMISAGFKNIENQQIQFQKLLEERTEKEKERLTGIIEDYKKKEKEREDFNRYVREQNREYLREFGMSLSGGPSSISGESEFTFDSEKGRVSVRGEDVRQRHIDRWAQSQFEQGQKDPRRVVLSEPSDEPIVAGEDIVATLNQTDANLARLDELMRQFESSRADPRRQ